MSSLLYTHKHADTHIAANLDHVDGPHRHTYTHDNPDHIDLYAPAHINFQPSCIPRMLVFPPVPHSQKFLLAPATSTQCLTFLSTSGAAQHEDKKAVDPGRLEEYPVTAPG